MQHFAFLVNAEQIVLTHQDKFLITELHLNNTKRTEATVLCYMFYVQSGY